MQGDDLNMMMPESPPHPGDQEMISNDEAHDQLGDLPFNGGMATFCTVSLLVIALQLLPLVSCVGFVGAAGRH